MVMRVAELILTPGQIKQYLPIWILPFSLLFDQTVNLTLLSGIATTFA
jgi:hypothetical protein